MSVTAWLYVDGEVTDERAAALQTWLDDKVNTQVTIRRVLPDPGWNWPPARIEVAPDYDTLFDVGYPRGDWPTLYALIRLMQAAFPDRTVYYAGQHAQEAGELVTEERMAAIWDLYVTGDPASRYAAAAVTP